jgi:DNA-directed RNA polymerase alpha subunit
MNPKVTNIGENNELYTFTLSNVNVSFANAIRRTILSDIPTLGFYTETFENNDCNISINTCRLHNEIIKQRLSCIPVHEKDLKIFPGKYVLELDIQNNTENMRIVTTEDFRIREKNTGEYIADEEVHSVFPPCMKTNMYIDFIRLRPKIGEMIPGEQIKLTSEFSVHTAKENSVYNIVSICTYQNTPDRAKQTTFWESQVDSLSKTLSEADIAFRRKNFESLDSQRIFVPDSFDFTIQTIGVYDNREIVSMACSILINTFKDMIENIESNTIPINTSETTMENCFDVILEKMDYTIGKILEAFLFEKHYKGDEILSFCGFKKFHPHDEHSVLRLAFREKIDKAMVASYLRNVSNDAIELYKQIGSFFQ